MLGPSELEDIVASIAVGRCATAPLWHVVSSLGARALPHVVGWPRLVSVMGWIRHEHCSRPFRFPKSFIRLNILKIHLNIQNSYKFIQNSEKYQIFF
jgi:hypothetical protein